MTEFKQPKQLRFEEINLSISKHDRALLSFWIAHEAKLQRVTHIHSTTKDSRDFSHLRKTFAPLHNGADTTPPRIADLISEMYEAAKEPTAAYLGVPLESLRTKYATAAHLYLPGDEAGEGHVDYYPSTNFYFDKPSEGGQLLIAGTDTPHSIEEIRANAYRVTPEPGTLVLFEGCLLPHFVEAIPTTATGFRSSINTTYFDGQKPTIDYRHPRHNRWADQQ